MTFCSRSIQRTGRLFGLAAAAALLALLACSSARAGEGATVSVDAGGPFAVSRFRTGATLTQYSLDELGDAPSIERGKRLLASSCYFLNQHIMGWGAGNPEPSPGVYQWRDLDRRTTLIRSIHAVPVITLCGAPDWMKGGRAGETDWSKLEVAPLPEHAADFAELARQVALRYPDVRYFQVWNEMKGLWDPKANNWDYRRYTTLYNLVYDALKAVNPEIHVGGPYLVIEGTGSRRGDWSTEAPLRERQWEVIDYWLKNKHGADFITLDRGIIDFHDHGAYADAQRMELTSTFGEIARQIHTRTDLPLWWAEYYGASGSDRDLVAANYASILLHMVENGTSAALLWQPQDDGGPLTGSLFTDTREPGGGQPLPLYDVLRSFHDDFGAGVSLYHCRSSDPLVEALASDKKVLLINKHPDPMRVTVGGTPIALARYQVKVVDR